MPEINEMSKMEIEKRLRDLFQLRRDLYANISRCKEVIEDAGKLIDAYEAELRKRGHI